MSRQAALSSTGSFAAKRAQTISSATLSGELCAGCSGECPLSDAWPCGNIWQPLVKHTSSASAAPKLVAIFMRVRQPGRWSRDDFAQPEELTVRQNGSRRVGKIAFAVNACWGAELQCQHYRMAENSTD